MNNSNFRYLLLFSLFLTGSSFTMAQSSSGGGSWAKARINAEGDTLIYSSYAEVRIVGERQFEYDDVAEEFYRIKRLRRDIDRVRPYAAEAAAVFENLYNQLETASTKKERKSIVKQQEYLIQLKFEGRISTLTKEQAEIFVKLIHRNTGLTVFEHLQRIKGKTSAFYWQSLAGTAGANLKLTYNPDTEDRELERLLTGEVFSQK